MITMKQETYKKGYYIPELGKTISITRDQDIDEDGVVGKALIEHYGEDCIIDGEKSLMEVVNNSKDAIANIGAKGFENLVSDYSVIDGSLQSNGSEKIGNTNILDINDLTTFSKDGLYKDLLLPNPYPSEPNEPVHPSIVKCDSIFNGFKYWLAYTPYPNSNSDFENPCVIATNDFKTFAEPASNPLVDKPAVGYNADTHLVFNEDYTRLYLLYRQRGGGQNSLNIMHTDDGITWTTPVLLFTSSISDFASPSAWFNGSKWVIIYHDLDAVVPRPMYRVESVTDDIYGSYSVQTEISIPLSPNEANQGWWHSYFERVSDNQVIGLVQDNFGVGGSGELYLVQSFDDGLNFDLCDRQITRKGGYYRSTFFRDLDSLVMFPCTLHGKFSVFRAKLGFIGDKNNFSNKIDNYLINNSYAFSDILFLDSFNRANSQTIGTSDSGQTMSTTGSGYEIKDNKAFALSNGAKALIDVLTPSYTVHTKINMTDGPQQWVIIKQIDSANFIRVGINSGATDFIGQNISFQEVIDGSVANSYVYGAKIITNDILSLECQSSSIKVLLNNEIAFSYVPSVLFKAGSTVGMQSNIGATSSYEYFIVTK